MIVRLTGRLLGALAVSALLVSASAGTAGADVRPPAYTGAGGTSAQGQGQTIAPSLPSNLDNTPAAERWTEINEGTRGTVSIPDEKAGRLIQTQGMQWLEWRRDYVGFYGLIAIAGMLAFLTLFFMVKGRIKIDSGRSGRKIQRFKPHEVVGHWMTAGSFLILALTGLNMLYGRPYILPLTGPDFFSGWTRAGKYVHNYGGFVFMAGMLYIFVMWVRHNIWDKYDLNWILKGGGFFSKHSHPPADKFNFGQKTVFRMVILLGLGLSISGLNLLMPFWFEYSQDIETMQWIQIVHAGLGVGMFALMLAHIYIGSVGMESAFDAMKTGWVDINWAREHHSAWVERYLRQSRGDADDGRHIPPPGKKPAREKAHPAE